MKGELVQESAAVDRFWPLHIPGIAWHIAVATLGSSCPALLPHSQLETGRNWSAKGSRWPLVGLALG